MRLIFKIFQHKSIQYQWGRTNRLLEMSVVLKYSGQIHLLGSIKILNDVDFGETRSYLDCPISLFFYSSFDEIQNTSWCGCCS